MSDLVALDDVPGVGRGLDDVVDERVDPARPALPEECNLLGRQIVLVEETGSKSVVDVVVDVGDPVD